MDNENTPILELIEEVSSQPTTKYFNFPPKEGYNLIPLPKEQWFFMLSNSHEESVFILRSQYQVAACKIQFYNLEFDLDFSSLEKDIKDCFDAHKPGAAFAIRASNPKGLSHYSKLVVARQIFYQYHPIEE